MTRKRTRGVKLIPATRQAADVAEASGEPVAYTVLRASDTDLSLYPLEVAVRLRRTVCEDCERVCWMDPANYDNVAHINHIILCVQCVAGRAKVEVEGAADE